MNTKEREQAKGVKQAKRETDEENHLKKNTRHKLEPELMSTALFM